MWTYCLEGYYSTHTYIVIYVHETRTPLVHHYNPNIWHRTLHLLGECGWEDEWVVGWMSGSVNGWMGGWVDRLGVDGWVDGWIGGWIDGEWMGVWMGG